MSLSPRDAAAVAESSMSPWDRVAIRFSTLLRMWGLGPHDEEPFDRREACAKYAERSPEARDAYFAAETTKLSTALSEPVAVYEALISSAVPLLPQICCLVVGYISGSATATSTRDHIATLSPGTTHSHWIRENVYRPFALRVHFASLLTTTAVVRACDWPGSREFTTFVPYLYLHVFKSSTTGKAQEAAGRHFLLEFVSSLNAFLLALTVPRMTLAMRAGITSDDACWNLLREFNASWRAYACYACALRKCVIYMDRMNACDRTTRRIAFDLWQRYMAHATGTVLLTSKRANDPSQPQHVRDLGLETDGVWSSICAF